MVTRSRPLIPSHAVVTGRLTETKRLRNTVDGNPVWALTIAGAVYRTRANASVGGIVDNYRLGSVVSLAVNKQGSVIDMIEYVERFDRIK